MSFAESVESYLNDEVVDQRLEHIEVVDLLSYNFDLQHRNYLGTIEYS